MQHRRDFLQTLRCGKRVGRRDVVVHILLLNSENSSGCALPRNSKVGLIVGKQVGSSVVRKLVSRRLREAIREIMPHIPMSSMIVIRALPSSSHAEFHELRAQLHSAVKKIRGSIDQKVENT